MKKYYIIQVATEPYKRLQDKCEELNLPVHRIVPALIDLLNEKDIQDRVVNILLSKKDEM